MEIINDIDSEDPRLRKIIRMTMPDDFSHLRMDLKMENMRLGSLILLAEGKNRYTDTHAHLITLLHEPFAGSVSNILQHQEILRLKDMLADDNRYLHQEMLKMKGDTIIGANFGLRDIMKMVLQIAPLDSPVLLMGETGVGKEIVANAIHLYSTRKDNPCIRVNCGAIPENLIDSELFGHERGAFTGAVSRKRGRFERAHDGTIFLDEIGELSQAAQVKLLRVIQQHEIERVGGDRIRSGGRAPDLCNEPGSDRDGAFRKISGGPLVPDQCVSHHHSTSATTQGRYPRLRRALYRTEIEGPENAYGAVFGSGRLGAASGLSLAGKREGAGEPGRTGADPEPNGGR